MNRILSKIKIKRKFKFITILLINNNLFEMGANNTKKKDDVNKFRFIEGRRFHNVQKLFYDLPNDDDESEHFYYK